MASYKLKVRGYEIIATRTAMNVSFAHLISSAEGRPKEKDCRAV